MRIALLVCDHVAKPFCDEHGDYVYMFEKLLPEFELEAFHVVDSVFPNVDAFDAFIVTGSKHSVYDELDWIDQLKMLTKEAFEKNKKYLGVCFGHQLIAESLGGKVTRAETGYLIGLHAFKMMKFPHWIDSRPAHYKVLMLCQDQVVQLPPGAQLLAGSATCPVGMMTVKNHFLGIQGHPEFSKAYNQDVFESRSNRIGKEKVQIANESLSKDPDTNWLRTILTRFIRN